MRLQYLQDMAVLGDALLEVTGAYQINYAIYSAIQSPLCMLMYAHVIDPNQKNFARCLHLCTASLA